MNKSNATVFRVLMSGKNYHPSERSQNYVKKKFQRLEKYHPAIQFMDVRVRKDSHGLYNITTKMGLPKKRIAVIKEEGSSLFASIDKLYHKWERRLSKYNGQREAYYKDGEIYVS